MIPSIQKSTLSPDGTMMALSAWIGPDEKRALVVEMATGNIVWTSPQDDPAWEWEAETWLDAGSLLVRRELCGLPGANLDDPLRPPGLRGDDVLLGIRMLVPCDRFLLARDASHEWHLTPVPAISFTYRSNDVWAVTDNAVLFIQPYTADTRTDAHRPVFLYDLDTHATSVVVTLEGTDNAYHQVIGGNGVCGGRFLPIGWSGKEDAPLQQLSLLDVRTRQVRDLPPAPPTARGSCWVSPDTRTIAWFAAESDTTVLLQDADNGNVKPIHAGRQHVGGHLVWSGDSQAVATLARGEDPRAVVVISRETGAVTQFPLPAGINGTRLTRLQWMPGHQQIVCSAWLDTGVWELDLTSGKWRLLWTFPASYRRYHMSECPGE